MTGTKKRFYLGWSVLILLGAFLVRIWNLGGASYWVDELSTDVRVRLSFEDLFHNLMGDSLHTPLYYVTVHFFPTHTELLLRLPGALLGLIGVALIMRVAVNLYGDRRLALWAGALLAFNPYHVWICRMARPYAMVFVWALLASYFFLRLVRGRSSRALWIGFILSHAAAYMTHHFALMLPATQYIVLAFVVRKNPGLLRRWMGAQSIAGIPLLLWVVALIRESKMSPGISWIPRPAANDLWITFWNMTVGYDGRTHSYLVLGLIAAGVGLLLGLVYAVRRARADLTDFYWLCLILAPFALVFAISMSVQSLYVDRYFTPCLPAFMFLILRGWQQIGRSAERRAWTVLPVLLLVLAGGLHIGLTLSSQRDERQEWRGATAYIARSGQPGDVILVQASNELSAVTYYFGRDEMMHLNVYGISQGSDDIYPIYHAPEPPTTRLWAIYRDEHGQHIFGEVNYRIDPFRVGATPMATWLAAHRDDVVSEERFRGLVVVLLQIDPDDLPTAVSAEKTVSDG